MPKADSFYETDKAISEYLLFHYGEAPHFLGPTEALDFSKRCAALAMRHPLKHGRALDLGCAVGRSACELSAYFEETVGIDFSFGLIEAAERIRDGAELDADIVVEGDLTQRITLQRPSSTRPHCLSFQQGDAMDLPSELGSFDFVLMANLIDRLPDPAKCLKNIGGFMNTGGILAITSPYTWLEEYTPKEKWLGGFLRDGSPVRSYETLRILLQTQFDEIEALDMPFLIREHARKYQYSNAHATLWRKR
ncbi:putative 4-mercaptohistidine N1-methyltransferase [Pelagicoccus enzymogenes]|uniref:putative 4-mercaptohistidine N1-methyltransferase n=1 Tax=Pelagicoccus enzymogenes TaxID=2773457 RepID=UPI00280C6BE1|nr:putative 4-mercaptohistidine N1-methyltransferase [Pelagicoccus enzymogenes]MDQ8199045.1 putative 4-mercaptohistidine N1-methyltransferase [Pelagicoccus enzymogenes]